MMKNFFLLAPLLLMGGAKVAGQQCAERLLSPPSDSKTTYRVAVLAIRGKETAIKDLNTTFSTYLTAVAGPRFDPPLRFEMVPVAFADVDDVVDEFIHGGYDFVHVNPSIYSCIESESGATSLVSKISLRKVNGQVYKLTKFGGVIFTRAENSEINNIEDIKGKRVGVISISGLGSGQMQFRELQRNGIHHLQDPAQVMFISGQGNIVNAVLDGTVDVGYVRTDQLERTIDKRTGSLVDLNLIKIINPQIGLMSDGQPFPFTSSTTLYPEWNVGTFADVPEDVASTVQSSLLEMADHAAITPALDDCYEENSCAEDDDDCRDACFAALDPSVFVRCDTTRELAHLARRAMTEGKNSGWRTTLAYMDLRNMQEETGFITLPSNGVGNVRCVRNTELVDTVVCPEGHFRRSEEEILNGCADVGLPCFGYVCLCSPCVKSFDVDFFPLDSFNESGRNFTSGCAKFEICGTVRQMDELEFRLIDNKKRESAEFSVVALVQDLEQEIPVMPTSVDHEYQLTFSADTIPVGVVILQVFVGEEQIPESPFRIQVSSRLCLEDDRVADGAGHCVCRSDRFELFSTCVELQVILVSILIPLCFIVGVAVYFYVEYKKKQADAIWRVKPEELKFRDPPQILGRGTFGLVLLGEYRGTNVAVKRVLPPQSNHSLDGSRAKSIAAKEVLFGTLDDKMNSVQKLDTDESENVTAVESSMRTSCNNKTQKESEAVKSVRWDLTQVQKHGGRGGSLFDFEDDRGEERSPRRNSAANSVFADEAEGRYSMSATTESTGSGVVANFVKARQYAKLQEQFVEEMRHIAKLRHPCITTVMGAVISTKSEPMLVMEHMELGSFHDLLHNSSIVVDSEILFPILRDIARGLRFLHSAKPQVVHGDLKSHNVLVDSKLRAKVADFGFSQKKFFKKETTGTPYWMAPELLRGVTSNTAESDVYSFGIVLYEAFARREPYEGESFHFVLRDVANPKVAKRPLIPGNCPKAVADLMRECWGVEPKTRPTAEDIDVRLRMLGRAEVENYSDILLEKDKKIFASKRTQDILFDTFPKHVARAVRDGRKPEPEAFPDVTVCFIDIPNFADISQNLETTKLSDLLDRLHTKFDKLSASHQVFKVDTVGNAYMTVTNLASQQPEHARIMAYFVLAALDETKTTLIDEENPQLGFVELRAGFHSGPVVAHVVGSKVPRYSLLGDTVNVAAKMETTSLPDRLQVSEYSASLLTEQGPDLLLQSRGAVKVKGKGELQTWWVRSFDLSEVSDADDDCVIKEVTPSKQRKLAERLIEWNVSLLSRLLKQIVAHRATVKKRSLGSAGVRELESFDGDVINEFTEIIDLPRPGVKRFRKRKTPRDIALSSKVEKQLRELVSSIQQMYRDNPFHNFEHASHVCMYLTKLLARVVAPSDMDDDGGRWSAVHEYSSGISSDPLIHFSVVFAALVHDLDHPGVPNVQLVREGTVEALRYKGKSVAEQNSVELCWELLMEPSFSDLRSTIFPTNEEAARFRQLLVNAVLATDIVDKGLKAIRNNRWDQAFKSAEKSDPALESNRKATIVIEHLMQASDVAHMMQSWGVYRKWNERLFLESYDAFSARRADKNPIDGWYEGELGFFDFYIIPLAHKLKECAVFGDASDEFLDNARRNRQEWQERGREEVAKMVKMVHCGGHATSLDDLEDIEDIHQD